MKTFWIVLSLACVVLSSVLVKRCVSNRYIHVDTMTQAVMFCIGVLGIAAGALCLVGTIIGY